MSPPNIGRGRVIVVVEDEPSVLMIVQRLLEKVGFEVVPFTQPRAARAWLNGASVQPSMLITDVMLPGMNGFDLCAAARAKYSALPVLFMSGYPLDSLPFGSTDLPEGTGMVSKPFGADELRAAIEAMLKGRPLPRTGAAPEKGKSGEAA